ncbi:TRAP transporter small permease subunit [Plastorhodobacter daqingensis]|uniref:TRAP transporter small permease protein n=1 Tax=Plastorhodobacter daqingensis TaxID=1387281 RepID=A0ABW2UJ03_9RHOB
MTSEIKLDLDQVEQASARSEGLDFPRTWLSDRIEAVLLAIASLVNWIWLVLVLVIVCNVAMRYALSTNYIWIEEMQWHMYSVGFMIAIGYAILHDSHVRVDVLAGTFSARTRAVIEFLGLLLLVFPLIYLIISYAIPFVERAWVRNEASAAPGGLTNRWAIKSVIIIAFTYIGLAAFARFLRVTAFLFGLPRPSGPR